MSKQLYSALLSTVYKMDAGEIAEALKDSDLPETSASDEKLKSLFFDKDKEKVAEAQAHAKKRFDDGHKKATVETLSKLERDLRDEYEIENADLKGTDLIREIVTKQAEAAGSKTKPGIVTEELIKKAPLYLELERKFQTRERELLAEKDNAVKEVESTWKQKEVKQTISKAALAKLDAMKPILPSDPGKAQIWKDKFLQDVLAEKLEIAEDGKTFLILGEDGLPKKNEHGYALGFEDYVSSLANRTFEFPVSQERNSAGNGKGNQAKTGASGSTNIPNANNIEELAAILGDKTKYTLEERIGAQEAYEAKHGETA